MNGPAWLTSARSKLRALRSRLDRIHIALAAALLLGLATMPFLSAWPLFIFDLLALILFVVTLVMIIALAGLLALRPRRLAARYRQQPDQILWREGLAYYLWFALFHLAIIDLLLGLSLSVLWFYGPTSLTLALCCGLHASAALTAMGLVNKPRAGLRTLGLLWRGPMPQSPLAFLERLFAVLFLSRRYAHGLVQDRQQDAPVLVEITRTLDSARVGVNTRAISLWRDGFARWKGELSGRLWACTSMASSTMALALFLILILPQSQLYPDFLPGQPGRFALWTDLVPETAADSEAAKPEHQEQPDASPADQQDSAEDQTDATADPETSQSSGENQDRQASAERAEPNPRAPQDVDPSANKNEPPLDPSESRSKKPRPQPGQSDQPQPKTERHNGPPSKPGAEGRTGSESQAGADQQHRSQTQAGVDRQPGSKSQAGAEGRNGSQSQAGKDRQQASQPQANAERQSGAQSKTGEIGQRQKPESGDGKPSAPSAAPGQKKGAASESNQAQAGQKAGKKGQARPGSPPSDAAEASTAAQKPGQSASTPSSQPSSAPPSGAAGAKPGATPSAQASSQSASAQTAPGPPKPGSESGGNKPGSGTPSGKSADASGASSAAGQGQGDGKGTTAQNRETKSSERQASDPHTPSSGQGEPQAIKYATGSKGTGQVLRNYPLHADSLLTVELPPMEETPNGLMPSQGEPEQTWNGKATSESDQQAPQQEQGKAKDPKPRVVTQRLPNWVVPLLPAKNKPPKPE